MMMNTGLLENADRDLRAAIDAADFDKAGEVLNRFCADFPQQAFSSEDVAQAREIVSNALRQARAVRLEIARQSSQLANARIYGAFSPMQPHFQVQA